MCRFNQRPRMACNNCVVIVPAVPIQTGMPMCMPAGVDCAVPHTIMPMCAPAGIGGGVPNAMMQNAVPARAEEGCGATPNAMMQNAVPAGAGGIVPSGTMPGGALSGFTCNANFATVQKTMEAPVRCAPTVIHHHNRIQHFVPCQTTNIHHVHNHHEFIPFEQRQPDQVVNHRHGVRPSDQQLCNSLR